MSTLGCGRNGEIIEGIMGFLGHTWQLCRGATQWLDDNNEFFWWIKEKKKSQKKEEKRVHRSTYYFNILLSFGIFFKHHCQHRKIIFTESSNWQNLLVVFKLKSKKKIFSNMNSLQGMKWQNVFLVWNEGLESRSVHIPVILYQTKLFVVRSWFSLCKWGLEVQL